jgi:3-hydroxyisobutyrate dehydrogenase-like beta-hydroxyacid dehydrogenase
MLAPTATVCLLGFGETGRILGTALSARGCAVRAHDAALELPGERASMQGRIEAAGVHPAALVDALRGAKLVICTDALAGANATDFARLLTQGQIVLDLRDLPSAEKRAQSGTVVAQGAEYVDACWLASDAAVHLAAPMDLAGARAPELAPALNALGFNARAIGERDRASDERAHAAAFSADAAPPAAVPRQQTLRGELP